MHLRLLSTLAFSCFLASCSASGGNDIPSNSKSDAAGLDSGMIDSGSADSDLIDSSQSDVVTPTVANLKGKVFAPEGTIPISGALVYLVKSAPSPIPKGVYCDKCVQLSDTTPNAITAADGSFDMPSGITGELNLVVQKGAFRRVRTMTVVEGVQDVPKEFTTLPGKMDTANGDTIPKMAVVSPGSWDKIEVTLGKLGLATLKGASAIDKTTASFDLIESTLADWSVVPKFLKDPVRLSQYQIIFFPCSGSPGSDTQPACSSSLASNSTVKENLQNWVAAGGRLYATDWSYDFVRQPFSEYVDWENQTNAIGSACSMGAYDAPATVNDKGLDDWLTAQGVTDWSVEKNYTTIAKLNPVATTDVNGAPATITPKAWVSAKLGSTKPSTISFERACGRVLFSTYHTEADQGDPKSLLPQERALLYILLEVAVCIAPPTIN